MTERAPWWKAFLPRKKSGAAKDLGPAQGFGPDFNPFAQQSEKPKETPPTAASKTPCDQSQSLSRQESGKGSSLLSDDTFDDSNLESVFNEQTCRRNMKVSRSGRFKEKRRVRSTLPLEEKETENAAPGKGDVR